MKYPVPPPAGYRFHSCNHTQWVVLDTCADPVTNLPVEDSAALSRLPGARPVAGRTTHWSLETPGGRVILRAYRHGGVLGQLFGGWYASLGASPRPVRELAVSCAARSIGAPTPEVVAAVWKPAGPLGYRAWLVVREVEDALPLHELWDAPRGPSDYTAAVRAAGVAVAEFHDAGVVHPDLNAGNLLVQRNGGIWRGWIIDLDRARHVRALSSRERARALWRLFRSCTKHQRAGAPIPRVAAVQFLAAYLRRTACPVSDILAALRATAPRAHAKWWLSDRLRVSRPAAPHTVSCTTSP